MLQGSSNGLPGSSTNNRWFESIAQVIVLYSIVTFYLESEYNAAGAVTGTGFWWWNEWALLTFFACEYLYRWFRAEDRLRYPFTLLALIDLLAVGPALVGLALNFRSLKLLRALRMLWMFKLYRYNRALQNVMRGFRKVRHELSVVGFVAIVVLLFSSVAIYEFEHDAQPDKFHRLSDAMWWCFVTLATVGYGDLFPITSGGRVVAAMTMLFGIGIFGTFISLIGGSFLETMREERDHLYDQPEETAVIPIKRTRKPQHRRAEEQPYRPTGS